MHNGRHIAALGVAVALTLGTAGIAFAKGGPHFKDVGEASWAAAAIEELSLEGVLQGTGDGRFQPNGDVTLGQALALYARLSGQSGGNVSLAGVPAYLQGAVAVALRHGAIGRGDLKALNRPLTRGEAVELLVADLGLGAQAQATTTASLAAFKDARHLPPAEARALALAVSLGLIQGTNGQLGVHRPITRAELAVLLSRLEALLGANATVTDSLTFGRLEAVSGTTLTVTLPDGSQKTFTLGANAQIFLDNRVASTASLAAGDQVVIGLDANGEAIFVSATGPSAVTDEVEGTVLAVTASSITVAPEGDQEGENGGATNGSTGAGNGGSSTVGVGTTYPLAPNVVVTFQGQAVALSRVTAGDQVHLALNSSGQVVAIAIQRLEETVSGTVTALGHGGFLLTDSAGTLVPVKVDDATQVSGTVAVGAQVTVSGWYGEDGLRATSVAVVGASSGTSGGGSSGSP